MVLLLVLRFTQAEPDLRELVQRLRSESLEERERAMGALERAGTAALPVLEKAAKDGDPEIAGRAAQLLERLDARIESPDLKALVEALKAPESDWAKAMELMDRLVPAGERRKLPPSALFSCPSPEGRRFLIRMDPVGFSIPGSPVYDFHILDRQGKARGRTSVAAGNRLFVRAAGVENHPEFGGSVLRLDVSSIMTGTAERRQYYAVRRESLVLVRLETDSAAPVRNLYAWGGNIEGPAVPARTSKEWGEALRSADSAAALEALTWLGGTHRSPTAPEGPGTEAPDQARLVAEVREAELEILNRLRKSTRRWLREGADLALTPAYADR